MCPDEYDQKFRGDMAAAAEESQENDSDYEDYY